MAETVQIIIKGDGSSAVSAIGSVNNALGDMRETASNTGSRISDVFTGIASFVGGSLVTGAIMGVGSAFTGVAQDGFALNSSLEQTRASLVAMTKSGEIADQMLESIRKEAASTPFEFQEMANAYASLMPAAKQSGTAIDSLIKQAEILAASNPAQGLEGAAFSLREALSGDFVSIVERFNLPKQRLNELKKEGVPALEAISIAMKEMGLDASLVTQQAETFSGRMSTFQDSISTLQSALMAPIFELFKTGLMNAQIAIDGAMPKLQELATTVGTALAGAMGTGIEWLTRFGQAMQPVFSALQFFGLYLSAVVEDGDYFNDWIGHFRETLTGLLGSGVADYLTEAMINIGAGIETLRSAFRYFVAISEDGDYFNDWIGHFRDGLTDIVGSGLAETFTNGLILVGQTIAYIQDAIQGFQQFGAGGLVQALGLDEGQRQILVNLLAIFLELQDKLRVLGDEVVRFAQEKMGFVVGWFTDNMPLIKQTVETVLNFLIGLWQNHGDAVTAIVFNAFEFIKTVVTGALDLIFGLTKATMQAINGDWSGAWATIVETSLRVFDGLVHLFELALNNIWNVLKEVWPGIQEWWDGSLTGLVATVLKIADTIKTEAEKIGKWLIEGIWSGITSLSGWLADRLNELGGSMLQSVKDALGIASPSKEMAKVGVDMVWGLAVGIDQAKPLALSSAVNLARDVVGVFGETVRTITNEQIRPMINMLPQFGDGFDLIAGSVNTATDAMRQMASQSTIAFGQMTAVTNQAITAQTMLMEGIRRTAGAARNLTTSIPFGAWNGSNIPVSDGRTKPRGRVRRTRIESRQQPDGSYRAELVVIDENGNVISREPYESPTPNGYTPNPFPSAPFIPPTRGPRGGGIVEGDMGPAPKPTINNYYNLNANYQYEDQITLSERVRLLSTLPMGA